MEWFMERTGLRWSYVGSIHGIEEASYAQVAGLTERTFFRHFADKREALAARGTEEHLAWTTSAEIGSIRLRDAFRRWVAEGDGPTFLDHVDRASQDLHNWPNRDG